MNQKILTKEQAVSLLAKKLNCSPDALGFLFKIHNSESNHTETLMIPEQRLLN